MKSPESSGIIILSGPMIEPGQISPDTKSRLDTGLNLWHESGQPLILVGSGSELMFEELGTLSNGPSEQEVFSETISRETIGNAVYSKTEVLKPEGFQKANLVTADYHIKRASRIFKRVLGPNFQITLKEAKTHYSPRERKALQRKELLYTMIARTILLGYDSSSAINDERIKHRVRSIAKNRYSADY